MNPTVVPFRAILVLSSLGTGLFLTAIQAADIGATSPTLIGANVTSNGQIQVQWTPVPAADRYQVYTTPDLFSPFTEATSGQIRGFQWTSPRVGPSGFQRVSATQLSSNAILTANVLNRLTYGPTPELISHIAAIGPQAYIDEQLSSETITENLDTDPPIINSPPPPPPLTNWTRVSVTGTTTGTNFGIYMSGRGQVYLDDIRVVAGTVADQGPNLLVNGGFEDPILTNAWFAGSAVPQTFISNVSPTVDGQMAEGTNCVRLIATTSTTSLTAGLWQPFATVTPAANAQFTVSFSYLPIQNTSNTMLTVRLTGSSAVKNITLPPSPPTPPAAPSAVSPLYTKMTNTTGVLSDMRAYHVSRAVQSQRQLYEVLVQFFDNHFSTEYQKVKDYFDNNYSTIVTNASIREYLATDLEWREHSKWRSLLLNPNCTFSDLLKVSIESPAMIIYLDTILSTRTAANENYGRELLELHTMGADNGYIQPDIVDMAKVWTGWSVAKKDPSVANDPFAAPLSDPTNSPGLFVLHFRTNTHNYTSTKRIFTNNVIDARFGTSLGGGQPYSLIISNNAYPGTNGMQEGYLVLQHLANLPYTMEFVSVKLCRTFVHENFDFGLYDYTSPNLSPEAALVRDCMTAWATPGPDGRKGNIRSVMKVIVSSDLFRGLAASRQKIKTPLEFAVSAVRALRTVRTTADGYQTPTCDTDGYGLTGTPSNTSPLARMGGMSLFSKTEPDGYSEYGRVWLNTANLCERMRFVEQLLMVTSSSTKDDDYGSPGAKNTSDPVALLQMRLDAASMKNAGSVVDSFLDLLYPGEGRGNLDEDRSAAIDFLNSNEAGTYAPFTDLNVGTAAYDGRVRGMVALLMSFPRFQEQ